MLLFTHGSNELLVSNGDLLLTRSNTRDRVGDVCIATEVNPKTIICDLIYRLSLLKGIINSKFLMYQLLSNFGRRLIERDARGSSGTMPKISQSHIKSWRILLPPLHEQEKIVREIEAHSRPVLSSIDKIEREIDFLREYRIRLIADVVTGKLDVREVASRLPSEAPETIEIEGTDESEVLDELVPGEIEA